MSMELEREILEFMRIRMIFLEESHHETYKYIRPLDI